MNNKKMQKKKKKSGNNNRGYRDFAVEDDLRADVLLLDLCYIRASGDQQTDVGCDDLQP